MILRPVATSVPHDVWRQDRVDGAILLGSNLPLGPVAGTSAEWLHRWAADAPERVFVAERSGEGWREMDYATLLQQVRQVAAAHPRLVHAVRTVRPKLVFAGPGSTYADALALECFGGVEFVCSDPGGAGLPVTPFSALLRGDGGVDLAAAHALVGPDTVAKILFTSGSTANPKGVLTTQRMMCVNQAQMLAAMPFLLERPHRILDWLPWNHVFGGSHNFNLMLAHGGSLYIDGGKPTRGGMEETLRNTRERAGTLAFNVPVGFGLLVAAMRSDAGLRHAYFRDLDLVFYAAASVSQEVWDELAHMARDVTGSVPLMYAAWGMTETAPAVMQTHRPVRRPGNVGVPLPGVTLKLLPDAEGRCELRVKGPNVMPGYFEEPEKTRDAFDADGFLLTGDAVRFIDPSDAAAGLAFDGRIAEDFKLSTGTWVRATTLRLRALGHVSGFAVDVVLTGHDRDEIGLLIFPDLGALGALGIRPEERDGVLASAALLALMDDALQAMAPGASSSTRIARALTMAAAPSMSLGELTAKGSINARQVLQSRKSLVARLYDDADPSVVRLRGRDDPVKDGVA